MASPVPVFWQWLPPSPLAVLAAVLDAHWGPVHRLEFNFIALSLWLWSGILYIWIVVLIFYRYMFFRFSAEDLVPPYWINMGAMTISTLAGSLLIVNAAKAPYLHSLLPFLVLWVRTHKESKGKIERWHRTFRDQFLTELDTRRIRDLDDLNARLWPGWSRSTTSGPMGAWRG